MKIRMKKQPFAGDNLSKVVEGGFLFVLGVVGCFLDSTLDPVAGATLFNALLIGIACFVGVMTLAGAALVIHGMFESVKRPDQPSESDSPKPSLLERR
jgi:hypothetical protein